GGGYPLGRGQSGLASHLRRAPLAARAGATRPAGPAPRAPRWVAMVTTPSTATTVHVPVSADARGSDGFPGAAAHRSDIPLLGQLGGSFQAAGRPSSGRPEPRVFNRQGGPVGPRPLPRRLGPGLPPAKPAVLPLDFDGNLLLAEGEQRTVQG